jgi:dihydrodipicolinate synthase/N-acetylneuraminate lyase
MEDKGIYVANLTPFNKGNLDIAAVRAHVEFLVKAGVRGICSGGTTGEFLYLGLEERKQLFSAVIEVCAGRVKVLCCPWDTNAGSLAELCRFVSDKGADGIFLPPPIYYSFTDEEIIEFYEFAHKRSSIPVYCYNIPKYSNNEISIPALKVMVDRKLIAGIKDSSANEERIAKIVSSFGRTLDVFAGGDHFVMKAKLLGANGFISALGNVYPEPFVALWNTPTDEIQQEINKLRDAIKGYGGIPALKYLMSKRGFIFGCRFPFKELDKKQKCELDAVVEKL